MVYTALAALALIIALMVVAFAAQLLLRGSWVLGWLRGMSGLLLLLLSAVFIFVALDFYSYKQLSKEQSIATLGFDRVSPQVFNAHLVDSTGMEQRYTLKGDLWQLDARILKWSPAMMTLGLSTGYRLDRLNGRYHSLEDENTKERTVHSLSNSKSILDVWDWLRRYAGVFGVVDANYGSAAYLPMEDGALFAVTLSANGLIARPLNDRAKTAIEGWQ